MSMGTGGHPCRSRMRASALTMFVLAASLACACGDEPAGAGGAGTGPFTVYTVHYPLQYIAERIGGDAVRVVFPMQEDEDPAFWRPDDEVVRAYQQADLVLANGADYAKWLAKVTLAPSKLVDCAAGFQDRLIQVKGSVVHQHGPEGPHSHAGTAFTTWIDPELTMLMAEAVHAALSARLPGHRQDLDGRLASLRQDLKALDLDLLAAVGQDPDRPVVASHPVYQYLARHLGMKLESMHWEPSEKPSEEQWAALATLLARHPAKGMLWEDTPLPAVAERLRGLGLRVEVFDPCARPAGEGDYLARMHANAVALARLYAP